MSTLVEPLSREALGSLLRRDGRGHLHHRESSSLEFKESFNWSNRAAYAKTMSAFANARGGYMLFGVKNKPRELVGLRSEGFERLDDAEITHFLNEYLEPEVRIERITYESEGFRVGAIYVHEAEHKPVMCSKNWGDDLKESDIYYRYRGSSRRIKYAELKAIINKEATALQDRLMETIVRVGKIGIGNAVLFDTAARQIHSADGRVIVDERLLEKVKFILEGKFDEIRGDPTLRVIGDAASAQVVTHEKAIAVRAPEILKAFFGHSLPEGATALDVLEQLPYESSSFLPAFYFAREAGLTNEDAASLVERSLATGATKGRVVAHLRNGCGCARKGSLRRGASPSVERRRELCISLTKGSGNLGPLSSEDLKLALEALTHLSEEELRAGQDRVLSLLEDWFDQAYTEGLRHQYGVAVCHVDEALFRE